jgi:hypothetical protein
MIFGRLFGGGEAPAATLAVVRNITIGRMVRLDPLAWRRLTGSAFTLERDTLEITAQGVITLDDGSHVHRFYTDDELMLQAVSQAADGSDADDFTLFKPWSSTYPADRRDGAAFRERLEQVGWTEPGLPPFQRFWYEGDDRPQPPVGKTVLRAWRRSGAAHPPSLYAVRARRAAGGAGAAARDCDAARRRRHDARDHDRAAAAAGGVHRLIR